MNIFRNPSQSRLLRVIARALIAALVSLSLPQTTQASFSRSIDASPIDVVDSFADLPSLSARPTIAVVILVADDAAYAFVMPADLLCDVVSSVSEPEFANKYHRARWMDPRVGRWVSMDPWEGSSFDPVSLHRYLYAYSNPLFWSDPTGYWNLPSLIGGLLGRMALFAISCPATMAALGLIVNLLLPVEVHEAMMASGMPGVMQFGAVGRGEARALRLVKNSRMLAWASRQLRGRFYRTAGIAFENFAQRYLFPGAQRDIRIIRHKIDFIWHGFLVELKTSISLDSRGRSQLSEFSKAAKSSGQQLVYIFLNKPEQGTANRIYTAGGVVFYVFD